MVDAECDKLAPVICGTKVTTFVTVTMPWWNFYKSRLLLLLLHPFNGLFSRTTWVSWYQKGKNSLDLHQAIDDGVFGCSGINWTTCKQSAPRSRQKTTPTPHHSIFTGRMLFLTPNQQRQSTEGIKVQTLRQTSRSKNTLTVGDIWTTS